MTTEKKTILIVDDAKPLREVLKEWLTNANYEALEAKDGKEEVSMYKKYSPDLGQLYYVH